MNLNYVFNVRISYVNRHLTDPLPCYVFVRVPSLPRVIIKRVELVCQLGGAEKYGYALFTRTNWNYNDLW